MPLTQVEVKVLDLIDKRQNDNVTLLQQLVQIPSFTGEEAEFGKFLVNEIPKYGLSEAKIVQKMMGRPNIVAHYRGETGKPSITVYSHFDTVPVGDIRQWHFGPLSGQIVGNKIYGRGVKDHKFPIPALLFAIKAIKDAGIKLKGDIVFVSVCDEEFGGHQGMRFLVEQGICNTDYLLYASGGTDGKTFNLGANARGIYIITVKGKTVHTGRNDKGINAAYKAAKLILHLEKLAKEINNRKLTFKMGNMEFEGLGRFSVNTVHAFTTWNNVPDSCVLQIDRRLIPKHETFESGQAEIQAAIDALKQEDPDFDAKVAFHPDRWMNVGLSIPDKTFISSFQRAGEKVLGFAPTLNPRVNTGSSDHGWFHLAYPDRPFLSYGVSRGSDSHSYDEFVTIDGLIDTTKVYALFLMDLLEVA